MKIFLKPKTGHKVPRPEDGRFLEEAGESVELNTYWRRRISDGSVTEVKGASEDKAESKAAESKSDAKKGAK